MLSGRGDVMGKRKKILVGVLVGGGVMVGLWFGGGRGEPVFNKRPLSEWVEVSKTNELAAYLAIRQIGTNALPQVIDWLHVDKQAWRRRVFFSMRKLPKQVRPKPLQRWLIHDPSADKTFAAFVVLDALGEQASPIAPELLKMSRSRYATNSAELAIEALSCLGTTGLQQLREILRDPKHPHRPAAAMAIGEMLGDEPEARQAVPELIQCLQASESNLVLQASDALSFLPPSAESVQAVHALSNNLSNPDPTARLAATNALMSLAPQMFTNSVASP